VIFFTYIILKLYISIMQIGYISKRKEEEPFLLSGDRYVEAGKYSIEKERLNLISTILEYGLFIFWINDGLQILENFSSQFSQNIQTLLFIFGFLIINWVVNLPIEIYQKFVVDEKYGFNRSSKKLYLLDTLKEIFLTVLIGTPIILGISLFIESSQLWWLWSFLTIFAILIFVNMVYPTLIAPIFNKMSPMEDGELKEKIETLLQKVGFHSSGIFVMDASKRDSRLNAYFGGFGKSKRVVLFDTLIEKLNHQELLAVLGHELGHFKHGDIFKNMSVMGALLFGMFYIIGNLPAELFQALQLEPNSQLLIALFILFMPLFSFVIMPLFGAISRRSEYMADQMGSKLSGNSLFLKEALKKLVIENKYFPNSHPLYIFFYYTHPPVADRLKELEKEEK
jgi:STE24 endopeptidase